jgi:hypothetical protein
VVLVGDRRAEERHDPVAHDLIDGALIAVNRLHHAFEDGVEEFARLLGVAVGEQLHRALEVGEENRDLLPLAFEGDLGGEDPLGEVLGGVAIRGGEFRCRCAWAQEGAALPTELLRGSIRRLAGRTDGCKACPTVPAEFQASGVLAFATGTPHAGRPQIGEPGQFITRDEWADLSRGLSGGQGLQIRSS